MHRYRAYGLSIASEIELPELVTAAPASNANGEQPPDVIIRLSPIDPTKPANATGSENAWATSGQVMMAFPEGGRYLITGGREIVVDRAADAEPIAVRLFLLGAVLATLLHQRGLLVLHASAVRIGGAAVAFLAEKGTGKSTLAAAFHAHGHTLVADDIVPVEVDSGEFPMAYPGFPQLKLYPEAAEQLGGRTDDLPRLLAGSEKRARRLTTPFPEEPLPLRRVYVLIDGDIDLITPLAGQQAFMSLVQHTFVLPLLQATATQSIHFRQAMRLATMAPVCALQRRRSLERLPDVVRMVEEDLLQP